MIFRLIISVAILSLLVISASAQTVVSVNSIRARSVITAQDVTLLESNTVGGIPDLALVIGMEARVNLYPGRPILFSDIGVPAILERNQLVVMVYTNGALSISAAGRMLERGGVGEMVKVMNLSSRMMVIGRIMANGTVEVGL